MVWSVCVGVLILMLLSMPVLAADDIVLADFEASTYGDWTVEGEAFGTGPARGTLPNQMPVGGYKGRGLASSYHKGDGATGTLTSPPFEISRKYLSFLIGGGGFEGKTCMNLLVEGQVVRTATGPNTQPGGSEELIASYWDVVDLQGRQAVLRIVDNATDGWGHISIDQIVLSDVRPEALLRDVMLKLVAEKRYLQLPVRAKGTKRPIRMLVDGKPNRNFQVELADLAPDWYAFINIEPFRGRTITLVVDRLPDKSKALSLVHQADEIKGADDLYHEALRPQIHFSSRRGWLNDPNGLVYYKGTWHLFYQHNPFGTEWGNMHWGHATSSDLMHWQEEHDVLAPDAMGTIFSGSAVVDWNNSSGMQTGPEKPVLLFYTAAGTPFTQCMACSADGGLHWSKYDGNPILEFQGSGNRDPKVFWHEQSQRWIMVLYVPRIDEQRRDDKNRPMEVNTTQAFGSTNLREWNYLSRIDDFYECPDLFELPVIGLEGQSRWVTFGADGHYMLGEFDGRTFKPLTGKLPGQLGGNFYAAQTYSDTPDGRRILVGWMAGGQYPGMPFSQQMSLPLELTLRNTPAGIRLCKWPVKELAKLVKSERTLEDVKVPAGHDALGGMSTELLDIEAELDVGTAQEIGFEVRGVPVLWSAKDHTLHCQGKSADVPAEAGHVKLRIISDRTSIEVFASDGAVYMPFCFVPAADKQQTRLIADAGEMRVVRMTVRELKSVWE